MSLQLQLYDKGLLGEINFQDLLKTGNVRNKSNAAGFRECAQHRRSDADEDVIREFESLRLLEQQYIMVTAMWT